MNQFVSAFLIVFIVMASQLPATVKSDQHKMADTVFRKKVTYAYISHDVDNTFVTFQPTAQRIAIPEDLMKSHKVQPDTKSAK